MNYLKDTITFVGNAIVDIVSQSSDETLRDLNIKKGSMQLIDEKMAEKFLTIIKNPTVISGGSAANTAVGFSSLGGVLTLLARLVMTITETSFLKILINLVFSLKKQKPQQKRKPQKVLSL